MTTPREQLARIIDHVDDQDWRNIFPEERDQIAQAILDAGWTPPSGKPLAAEQARALGRAAKRWVRADVTLGVFYAIGWLPNEQARLERKRRESRRAFQAALDELTDWYRKEGKP